MARQFKNPSQSRSFPCPHYPHCFGCPLIAIPYTEQLKKKRERLAAELTAFPLLAEIEVPQVIASPYRLGYRARVKLVVRKTKGEIAAGLYVPGTHRVMDISSCPVHPRPVNLVVAFLKRKLLELEIMPYDERNDSGQLRYLDLRYSFMRSQMTVTLVTRHRDFAEGKKLAHSLKRRFPFVVGVIQNVNEQRGNVIWGAQSFPLAGEGLLVERVGSFDLGFPSNVFSQANPAMAAKIYEKIVGMAALTGKESLVDLYCGVGAIALHLASVAGQVWGVDDSELSIAAAKQNARRNGISNCHFLAGDVATKLDEVKAKLSGIDVISVNPPRKGLQPAALDALTAVKSGRLIYVSCDPKSLARDLNHLVEASYVVRHIQPFDMFPQTTEVETLALFVRR